MADLQKVRVQLLDTVTGAVVNECDVLTSPSAVMFSDGKNLTEKLNAIELTPGPQGERGAPFKIKKLYPSIAAMNAGFATDEVAVGEFVVINTGNVTDEDNARLYCKTDTQYSFITDLSGAQGLEGPQGIQGVQGTKGEQGTSGTNGAQGIQGIQGKDGIQGEKGDTVKVGTSIETAVQQSLFLKVVG